MGTNNTQNNFVVLSNISSSYMIIYMIIKLLLLLLWPIVCKTMAILIRPCSINSLVPGGFENIFQNVFFKLISWIDTLSNSCETALRSMPQNPSDDKSTLVQVMAWCRQAASHYLSQCCPRSLSPYGVTRPHWSLGDVDAILECNFQSCFTNWYIQIVFNDNALRCMPWNLTDKSKLVKVMAWCCQATSHYMNQCRPGPRLNIKTVLSTYGDFHVKDKTAVRTSYL